MRRFPSLYNTMIWFSMAAIKKFCNHVFYQLLNKLYFFVIELFKLLKSSHVNHSSKSFKQCLLKQRTRLLTLKHQQSSQWNFLQSSTGTVQSHHRVGRPAPPGRWSPGTKPHQSGTWTRLLGNCPIMGQTESERDQSTFIPSLLSRQKRS